MNRPDFTVLNDSWLKIQTAIMDVDRQINIFYAGELKSWIEESLADQKAVYLRTELISNPVILARLNLDYAVDKSYLADGFVKIERRAT